MSKYLELAHAMWPEARYIHGDGRYCTVRACGGFTVVLHETEQEARSALRRIHPVSYRGCQLHHALVVLDE
ncbi:hypothetical protein ABC795_11235 [Blastococcus sp. HT6-30]|uniref:hypothetical protein n=1 Tax=Blastococcus sp. HT6-30 TaxID=3144843 RepID=UPI003219C0FA